jgi:hypothetical protein
MLGEAEALSAAIVATVQRLSIDAAQKPPARSIKV